LFTAVVFPAGGSGTQV